MNESILRIQPSNLPVYVYYLEAHIALVLDRIAYKIRYYSFKNIRVAANQPLTAGDVLMNNCCYYANESTQVILDLREKNVLGGDEIELKHYYGCLINKLAISLVDADSMLESCGAGECTVFIELSTGNALEQFRLLHPREHELDPVERLTYRLYKNELFKTHDLAYWQSRIPDWDERLECIGEVPNDLIY